MTPLNGEVYESVTWAAPIISGSAVENASSVCNAVVEAMRRPST